MLSQLHREAKCEKLCRLSFDCYVLRILFVSTNVLFCVFGAKIAAYFCGVYALQGCRKKLWRKDLNLKFGSHLLSFITEETLNVQ